MLGLRKGELALFTVNFVVFSLNGKIFLSFYLAFMLYVISANCCFRVCLGASGEDAWSAISDAESMIADCYMAIVDAERCGANITGLVEVLNEAGLLLSLAKLAYSSGDYENAINYAGECQSMLEGFIDRAEVLRREAQEAGRRDFMFNFVGSGFGALGILIGGYAAWFYLVRREERRGA